MARNQKPEHWTTKYCPRAPESLAAEELAWLFSEAPVQESEHATLAKAKATAYPEEWDEDWGSNICAKRGKPRYKRPCQIKEIADAPRDGPKHCTSQQNRQ